MNGVLQIGRLCAYSRKQTKQAHVCVCVMLRIYSGIQVSGSPSASKWGAGLTYVRSKDKRVSTALLLSLGVFIDFYGCVTGSLAGCVLNEFRCGRDCAETFTGPCAFEVAKSLWGC